MKDKTKFETEGMIEAAIAQHVTFCHGLDRASWEKREKALWGKITEVIQQVGMTNVDLSALAESLGMSRHREPAVFQPGKVVFKKDKK